MVFVQSHNIAHLTTLHISIKIYQLAFKNQQSMANIALLFWFSFCGLIVSVESLFNEAVSVMFWTIMIYMFMQGNNLLGIVFFSFGVGIKMSAMLYLPAVYFIWSKSQGIFKGTLYLGLFALLQAFTALPFVSNDPIQYSHFAFNFSRQIYAGLSYNWRLLPNKVVSHTAFAIFVLSMHLGLLLYFLLKKWIKLNGKNFF